MDWLATVRYMTLVRLSQQQEQTVEKPSLVTSYYFHARSHVMGYLRELTLAVPVEAAESLLTSVGDA